MVDMGGMTLDQYAFWLGMLGIICGIAWVLGIVGGAGVSK